MDSLDLSLPHTRRSLHTPPLPPPPSTDANFPILAISILGILATSILLLIYYVFAVRCRLSWRRSDAVTRFSSSLHRPGVDRPMAYPAVAECGGLGKSEIQAIPTFRYRSGRTERAHFHECAVCLNEFQKDERIRLLPNCFHVFHIDCIDTWLQANGNCPLCRAGVTTGSPFPLDHLMASIPGQESSGDVVIDVIDDGLAATAEEKGSKAGGTRHGSMGDECVGEKGPCVLQVQPIRRSFSVDSLMDRQLHVALEMILGQNLHLPGETEAAVTAESGGRSSPSTITRTALPCHSICLERLDQGRSSSTFLQ